MRCTQLAANHGDYSSCEMKWNYFKTSGFNRCM